VVRRLELLERKWLSPQVDFLSVFLRSFQMSATLSLGGEFISDPSGSDLRTGQVPEYLLVLTATVTPSAGVQLRRNDPVTRREDYKRGFRFWLKNADPRIHRILFLENSGEDLTFLKKITEEENTFAKTVEFISTPCIAVPAGLHYGWGELKMLDHGLSQSRLVKETSHFIKATGRFTFPNIGKLLDRTPAGCEVMVDCRIPTSSYRKGLNLIPALLKRQGAGVTTQLMIFSLRFYQTHLLGRVDAMKPFGYPGMMEELIYDKLIKMEHSDGVYLRFPVNCDPSGVGATLGDVYDSKARRVVRLLRAASRKTGLWF
jgi:hypothetical protein